jgi:hypothetical protein
MHLGEEGTEQFTVTTRVNDEIIKEQPIHDPFLYTTVTLRGWKHAWNLLRGGIRVSVSVSGSHGAMRAIMSLDPHKLNEDTQQFLEHCAQRRAENDAAGVVGCFAEQK